MPLLSQMEVSLREMSFLKNMFLIPSAVMDVVENMERTQKLESVCKHHMALCFWALDFIFKGFIEMSICSYCISCI